MLVSQVLLCLFVAYWLQNQYNSEKTNLKRGLQRDYMNILNDIEMRKTYEFFIKPIIENKDNVSAIKFTGFNPPKEVKDSLVKIVLNKYAQSTQFDSLFYYYEKEEPIPYQELHIDFYSMLSEIYSTELIFDRQYLSSRRNYQDSSSFNLAQKLFKIHLKNKELDIKPKWVIVEREAALDPEDFFITTYYYLDKENYKIVRFQNYTIHIIKNILPQIIFIIVLLSLSAFALLFTFRSYIKQIKLNMLRSDFINNITHELKIPVATAKAALEALRSFGMQMNPEKLSEYLEMVSMEMNRLDNLTTRVLNHSKLEKHQHHIEQAETEMNSFILQIVQKMNTLSFHNIQIDFEKTEESIHLAMDPVYVEGVIRNLIENSLKYGGDQVHIKLKLWQENKKVLVSVQDNGPGIPKEYLDKVFDKFFRIPTGDQHNVKGFGLGLSFASLVMQQHKGSICAENLKGGGCIFTLKFPVIANASI